MPDFLEPVANALAGPPIQLLRPHLQPGIFSGRGDLPGFNVAGQLVNYGVIVSVQHVPPQLGRTSGNPAVYTLPLVSFLLVARLQNTQEVLVQRMEAHELDTELRWVSPGLSRVAFETLPGVTWAFSYLGLS